jgi:transcriptional regulator with XRE-family HTH domain
MTPMDIPKIIKNKRIQLGLTQTALAKLIGKKRTTVTHYESGKIIPPANIFIMIQELNPKHEKAA